MPLLFSVPIFFIVFRETLEAAIIVSVLLSLVSQLIRDAPPASPFLGLTHHGHGHGANSTGDPPGDPTSTNGPVPSPPNGPTPNPNETPSQPAEPPTEAKPLSENTPINRRALTRHLRLLVFLGALSGLFIALAIGAAFIAVWFTKAADLWSKSEDLWEGIFNLLASLIIFPIGVGMLKLDRAKARWRLKLEKAFARRQAGVKEKTRLTSTSLLFLLPLITVLREGLEAVIFVGGVSLGQPATSIPIATVAGLAAGIVCGVLIYLFASRTTLSVFLVIMTNFILLIGAGLFSRAVWSFQMWEFEKLVGSDVDDISGAGDGPGSFNVIGSVWHLDCCNPEDNTDGDGWGIFNAVLGWTNSANVGSILSYIFYWLCVVAVLIYMKYTEGRTTLFGRESAEGTRRRLAAERAERAEKDALGGIEDGDEGYENDGKEKHTPSDSASGSQAGHGHDAVHGDVAVLPR